MTGSNWPILLKNSQKLIFKEFQGEGLSDPLIVSLCLFSGL